MSFGNVKLIVHREIRDQLRDRRTLFTIVVLPLLLYPLLGMTFLQITQFIQQHPAKVWLVGVEQLPPSPPLLAPRENDFLISSEVSPALAEQKLLEVTAADTDEARQLAELGESLSALARRQLADRQYDAVVIFPSGFAERLRQMQQRLEENQQRRADPFAPPPATIADDTIQLPVPEVFYDASDDRSRVAHDRLSSALRRWRDLVVRDTLIENKIPVTAAEPFQLHLHDVAKPEQRQARIWSKILPFVLVVWALTGAFYPAVDLCAGEKERGTLETLLASPAQRIEIVWGKLLAIMAFSVSTALLNLLSMGATGAFLINRLGSLGAGGTGMELGPPPWWAIGWLIVALLPMSALFSALSLAIAAQARSTKEGQYYLMPLLLIAMPLMVLPILPAAELELGTAIIPVTGMILLLRTAIEGQYLTALLFTLPVFGVTAFGCWLSIRWAVDQFNNESVLFRENERWDLQLWLWHLLRDRRDTPTVAMAMFCGVMLLVIKFFAGLAAAPPQNFRDFAVSNTIVQIGLIAAPALIMALMLTRSPRQTLLLRWPRPVYWPLAVGLAVLIHPVGMSLVQAFHHLYPIAEETQTALMALQKMINTAPLPWVLVALALVPAVCEELVFRGFLLSGLRHLGHKWTAISISAVLFGVAHGFITQSFGATLLGLVLGLLAVQSGSLLPGLIFHAIYNALGVMLARIDAATLEATPALGLLFQATEGGVFYQPHVVAIAGIAGSAALIWLDRQPHRLSSEESLQRTMQQQSIQVGA